MSDDKNQKGNKGVWGSVITWVTVAATGVKLSSGPIISAFGFKTGGVAAGSYASAIHASIGSVKAGSMFATAQSLGATGLLIPDFGTMIGSSLLLIGVFYGAKLWKKKEQKFQM